MTSNQQERMFFSEEKNRKTFDSCAGVSVRAMPARALAARAKTHHLAGS
jgi:hypothetical protein